MNVPQPTKLHLASPEHNLWVDEHGRTHIVLLTAHVRPFEMTEFMRSHGATADAPLIPQVPHHQPAPPEPENAEVIQPQPVAPVEEEDDLGIEVVKPRESQ